MMRFALQSPDSVRVTQARRQRVGATAEEIVEVMARASQMLGLGRLKKRPTAVVVRDCKPCYTGTAGCDFTGHLAGGRAVYCEIKHADTPRFALSNLRPSQREELAAAHADGAAAIVVVLVGTLGVHWTSVVPWRVIEAALAAGDKSLGREVLEAWQLPLRTPLLQAAALGGGT